MPNLGMRQGMRLFRRAAAGAASNSRSSETNGPQPQSQHSHRAPAVVAQQPSVVQSKYSEACKRITQRYPGLAPAEILSRLIIDDVNRDAMDGEPPGCTGGETLACYLYSIRHHERLVSGINVWLQSQLTQYHEFPSSYACVKRAIDYIPQLEGALTQPVVARPPGLNEHMSLALPVRNEEVGRTARSRSEIRQGFMDSATASGHFMAQLEVNATRAQAPTFFTAKDPLARGRLLGPGQLVGANRLLQAKLNTSEVRDANSDDDEHEDERQPAEGESEEGMPHDPFVRFDGRWDNLQPALLGGSKPGYQYEPPCEGLELLGWKIKATFQTGADYELRWRYDVFGPWPVCPPHIAAQYP